MNSIKLFLPLFVLLFANTGFAAMECNFNGQPMAKAAGTENYTEFQYIVADVVDAQVSVNEMTGRVMLASIIDDARGGISTILQSWTFATPTKPFILLLEGQDFSNKIECTFAGTVQDSE